MARSSPVELVDTHCHIQSLANTDNGEESTRLLWKKAGHSSIDSVIAEAVEAGVSRMICVGCDLADSRAAIAVVKERQHCWASIGIHPHLARRFQAAFQGGTLEMRCENNKQAFSALINQPKVVAVGECGLDLYYRHSPLADQAAVLRFQIELALQHDLPLIFHVREAFDEFWPLVEQYQGVRGVLHSFTDSLENMRRGLKLGLYIGVNGIATFCKNPQQLQMYREIPLRKLLLETDAPFLTPTPYRGTINEPKRVGLVARFLADLRKENLEELATATTENALRLFGL